jgi:hypothetical protein
MAIGEVNTTAHPSGLTRRQRYQNIYSALRLERGTYDDHWRELSDFVKPRRSRFQVTDRNKGDRRSQNIIDSAPLFAHRTLQSGLHAGLTSPARPWMRLTTPDPDLAEFGPVKVWLHTVTTRMLTVFLRSNLYNALPTVYGDMGLFATSAVSILEDQEDMLRAKPYPIGSYVLGLDERDLVTTFAREYQLTVRQVIEAYGIIPGTRDIDWRRFSVAVKDAWTRGDYEQSVDVTWFVSPNEMYDPRRLESKYSKRWSSCHYETGKEDKDFPDGGGFLRESGYNEFPVLAPRWDVTAEDTYGTDSPGMVALGDVKGLQLQQKSKAKAIAKALDPPLKGPPELRNQKVSHLPGDITYVSERDGQKGLSPIHEVRLEGLQYLVMDMDETRQRVRRAFYEDLFLMLAMSDQVRGAQPVTAREIDERHEEKLLALGPVLERTNDELLDPLIDRTFAIMLRAGAIPEPPEELRGVDLKVEYLSIMAQAQKLAGVVGQDRFINSVLAMREAFPEVRHKVNAFQVVDAYGDTLGVNPKLVRTDEDAQELLEQEQQAIAAAQQAENAKQLAQAGAALGNTPVGTGSALDEVMGAMGGA